VRLLSELNDEVGGEAVNESIEDVLAKKPEWVKRFTLVIVHNLEKHLLENLSALLWEDEAGPPLVVVKSAGFLAEFFIQFHDHSSAFRLAIHCTAIYLTKSYPPLVIESHSDSAPSLRITNPFSSLLSLATSLDFSNMDPTDHSHVPYVFILVRVLEDWKKAVRRLVYLSQGKSSGSTKGR
jgi:NEDD8-activating enzyme E1 regulatory subunit